jgi:hypothetical protein
MVDNNAGPGGDKRRSSRKPSPLLSPYDTAVFDSTSTKVLGGKTILVAEEQSEILITAC